MANKYKNHFNMKAKKYNDFVNESQTNEKLKIFMKDILSKMVPAAFGYKTDVKMRQEIKDAVADAIEPILLKYNYIVESEIIEENVIQNIQAEDFNGADPDTIEVHNAGVGGVRTLQQHRTKIVKLLEQMLKDAKMAEKNHKLSYYSVDKILGLVDPERLGGVFLPYLRNHQAAVEELENLRKRGGSGKGKTVPKGLL
jgi:hypothetical protein